MKRFSIRLPPWHYKRLIWWADVKGQSVSGMGERTIAARIEANDDQIERMIAESAEDAGLTVEEWKRQSLERANYRVSDATEDLSADD